MTVKQSVARLYLEFCNDQFYTTTMTVPEMEVWIMDYPIDFMCNGKKRRIIFSSISKDQYFVKSILTN